ncbi:MAG TPA: rod shape-determining protein RodA [Acidimicrobiia bacterium]|nr:rod shape-determining protein RodA [Acidimicrobiia bacterium]
MSSISAVDLRPRPTRTRPDFVLIGITAALSALGLIMILSASAPRLEAAGISRSSQMVRQALFVGIGAALLLVSSIISDRYWKLLAPFLYAGAFLVLFAVLSPIGVLRQGAQRWISFGLFDLQPSEVAKVAVILALALLLAPVEEGNMKWSRLLKVGALVGFPAVLIFLQPDLGTMLVFGFVTLVMLFVAGTTVRQLVMLIVLSIALLVVAVELDLLKEYQLERLQGFLSPGEQTLEINYNQNQSQIAIGSGGLFGQGLFEGSQTNLAFVPSQTTDFIFTAVAEQLGFVGGTLVLALYAVMIWRMLMIAAAARDRFGQLAATGIAAMFGFHVFVNVGMTVGLLPVTGLPLPFLSFGGSFYLAMAVSVGIVNSIWMTRSPVPKV